MLDVPLQATVRSASRPDHALLGVGLSNHCQPLSNTTLLSNKRAPLLGADPVLRGTELGLEIGALRVPAAPAVAHPRPDRFLRLEPEVEVGSLVAFFDAPDSAVAPGVREVAVDDPDGGSSIDARDDDERSSTTTVSPPRQHIRFE